MEIQQIEQLKNAPEELRKAFKARDKSAQNLRQAKRQLEGWLREFELAEKEWEVADARYMDAIERWDQPTNTMAPDPKLELSL